jgi:arginine N-succinyltransferase
MFLIREVRPGDLDDLEELALHLDTINLPANRASLESLVAWSQDSFTGTIRQPADREFVFVLCDLERDKVIGTSMIIAQHGTFRRPSVYFNVLEEQKYSETLDKYFVHQVLQLTFNYDGSTEIGALILHPEYQGHPHKLGKLLSFVRFLFIGLHRAWFRDQIVAELLPPLNPDGTSDLWEFLGANFTGLDYRTADKLSRENVEFVRSLFPTTPIYTALLPEHVREKIGRVGTPTLPVKKMLESLGFHYDQSIDPFDGGPTYAVLTDQCELIRRTHRSAFAGILDEGVEADGKAFVTPLTMAGEGCFCAIVADYLRTESGHLLRASRLGELALEEWAAIAVMPLSGQDLDNLYKVCTCEYCTGVSIWAPRERLQTPSTSSRAEWSPPEMRPASVANLRRSP